MNSPFSNLKSALDSDFPSGTVVMFDLEGLPLVGIITGLKKDRYQIISTASVDLIELTRNRLHKVPTPPIQESKEKQLEFLKSVSNHLLSQEQIEELWKNATTHSSSSGQSVFEKVFHPAELTKLVFKEVTASNYITTRSSLISDRIFFRRDEKGFMPRKTNEVAERKEEDKKRQKRLADYVELVQFLRAKHKDKTLLIPESLNYYIDQLKMCAAIAAYPDETWHQEIEELLHFIEGQHPEFEGRVEQRAFHILYKAGILKKDSNLSFIRHNPRITFDSTVLAAADKLHEATTVQDFHDHSIRLDLTSQKCFTIDDSSTEDMDDALFLEETPTGYQMYVHISDVSSLIPKDSILDLEAKKRATSIYSPDCEIPMFPPKISHQLASLVVDKLRPAISVIFKIDNNFQITSADIEPSIIKVANRYSYDQIDQKLKTLQEPFATIASIANLHEQKRRDDGALPVTKRDAQPVVSANGDISIVEVDEQSPARALIGEMMVLANIVTANFLSANQIPALYRSQERPELDPALDLIPTGAAREYAQRGKLKRSVVDLHPMYHATLGTLRYVQSTSPIRRYLDLVLQRQLISFFKSEKYPYTEKDLTLLHQNLDEPLQIAMSVSKESKRFWMLRYLEKYYTDNRSIFGTVVRVDTKFPIVELDDLFINVPARISRPTLGNRYELKIERVDPRTDFVRLEEIRRR